MIAQMVIVQMGMLQTGISQGVIASWIALVPAPLGPSTTAPVDPAPPGITHRLGEHGGAVGLGAFSPASGFTSGASAADYDNDGDIDLFVPQGFGSPNLLFRNDGGVFTEVGAASGFTDTFNARCALWCDLDADGLLDLVVMYDQYGEPLTIGPRPVALFRQLPDHSFVEVTDGSGLDLFGPMFIDRQAGGMCAGDLTGDGLPDLVLTTWDRGAKFYENNGGMGFTDITDRTPLTDDVGIYWQPVMFDHEGDGDLDVFIAQDFRPNEMLINDGTGTFTDRASELGVDTDFNEMGVAIGDADNDGDFDFYVTNLYGSPGGVLEHNVYFERDNAGEGYTERAVPLGIGDGGNGWGTVFADLDNDGRLDLVEVNDHVDDPPAPWRVWMNAGAQVGTPVYRDVAGSIGFASLNDGSALLHLDADRDGDLDLVVTDQTAREVRYYENNAESAYEGHNWIVVRPRMPGTNNTRALGAVVKIRTGAVWRQRLITAGISHMAQVGAEAHFGIGASGTIDELVIEWPDGTTSTRLGVAPGQVLDITPAAPLGARDRLLRALPEKIRRADPPPALSERRGPGGRLGVRRC